MAWMAAEPPARLWAGVATWDGAEAPAKTLDYEEVLYVVSGEFGVELQDGTTLMGGAGDLLRIPEGCTVKYRGERATVIFVVTPPEPS